MVKSELIDALVRKHKDLRREDVDYMGRQIFQIMADALARGEEIELRGFGSFRLREYAPGQKRNPGTGEIVELGWRKSVLFKAGKKFLTRLNPDQP